ncbi:DNA replication/repair protein RecF [Saccharicrinis fermentans]|uniref:DNA replication and repair protein RecF n=1 Tax=Saccharicrinis fermentans DSM 9555 = JCM 21142 TaxID=869213 RepID=W7Y1W4_9BACT|nr:DNA replication/repair protein RecF [Saccharicrinis fermentans]GAF04870.1 DNA replication and repair protein RecF [Saccharicrinis fermentans DSM 9555 = JCM 21142]
MYLKQLHLINFKNIELAQLQLNKGINCFIGPNGAGKTNLLDAIYYMSFCKSFFNPVDSQNIQHKHDFFVIQGKYDVNNEEEHIYCGLKKGQKKQFKRNKKEYDKLSNHIGLLPLVMISPQDERLIVEGSEQRRKYIDSVISQYDKTYLEHLINYNKVISQRNIYLKKLKNLNAQAHEMLDIWDFQIIELGRKISHSRMQFLEELKPVFLEMYNFIAAQKEVVEFDYKSNLNQPDFEGSLKESREKDMILGYTTKGVHKDDVEFQIGGYPIKKMGSQGQKKTFLIALKLGQFKFLSEHKKRKPLLLLDDIFDKLDNERGDRLIELVGSDFFSQIFITDTQLNRIEPVLNKIQKESSIFMVDNGKFNN